MNKQQIKDAVHLIEPCDHIDPYTVLSQQDPVTGKITRSVRVNDVEVARIWSSVWPEGCGAWVLHDFLPKEDRIFQAIIEMTERAKARRKSALEAI